MNHNYQFHCCCDVCKNITDYFHLKSQNQAIKLGLQWNTEGGKGNE